MKKLKFLLLTILFFGTLSFAQEVEVGPNNFSSTINSNKAVLVKFWAPWCGPCTMLKPEFEKAEQIAGNKVLFATYNIDLRGEPLRAYNVTVIPTMILFVDGKEVARSNSILSAQDIADWVLGYVPQAATVNGFQN